VLPVLGFWQQRKDSEYLDYLLHQTVFLTQNKYTGPLKYCWSVYNWRMWMKYSINLMWNLMSKDVEMKNTQNEGFRGRPILAFSVSVTLRHLSCFAFRHLSTLNTTWSEYCISFKYTSYTHSKHMNKYLVATSVAFCQKDTLILLNVILLRFNRFAFQHLST